MIGSLTVVQLLLNKPVKAIVMSARLQTHSKASSPAAVSAVGSDRWVRGLIATAVLVRLVYFFEYLLSPLWGFYGADDVYYLSWAGRIAEGDWLGSGVFEQGPLYPYLLGALFTTIGPRVGAVLVLQLASGVAVAWLVYDCGQRLFDRTVGITAGFIAATFGPLVFYECMLMKSFLSPLLTMVAMNAGLRFAPARRPGWLAIAGLAVGLACLIQEHHILLLAPLILWVWLLGPTSEENPTSVPKSNHAAHAALAPVAVLVLSALLCIAPATIRNRIVAGQWVLVTAGGGEAFYIAQGPQARGFYNPPDFVLAEAGQEHEDFRREARRRSGQELSQSESSRYWFREGIRSITADPLRALGLVGEKGMILLLDYDVPDSQSYAATGFFVPALKILPSFGWIGGLGLVGVALCVRAGRRYVLPLGFLVAHVVPILIFYNFGRLRIGMMPLWILFAACSGVWIVRQGRSADPSRRRSAAVALIAAIGMSAAMFYPLLAEDFRLSDDKYIATLALRGQQPELAQARLQGIIDVLSHLPVEESQSVQYLAQVADVRRMLAQAYLQSGKWSEGVEQVRALRRLPARADQRRVLLQRSGAILEAALSDPRLAADPRQAAVLGEELEQIRAELP